MRQRENILEVAALKPDYLGFIFYPRSARYVSTADDFPVEELTALCTIGVFVDEKPELVLKKVKQFGLKGVQLHGSESAGECRFYMQQGLTVLKAIPIAGCDDMKQAEQFEGSVDLIVLDTKTPDHGGSGRRFDWELLQHYKANIPFLLSGGIGPDDVPALRALRHPLLKGLDLNSRFEIDKAYKDSTKIEAFIYELNT
jgi:phosphoribosylanthranilate isomerase